MASRTCGWCQLPAHLEIREYWRRRLASGQEIVQGAFECMNCRAMSVATAPGIGTHPANLEAADDVISRASTLWAPEVATGREFPDVPPPIASAADEAYRCASIGANKGAILLARTSIEATAKSKGITKGNLLSKIDAMVEQGVVRQVVADGAHEVRHLGNDMAHGDLDDEVSKEDVEDVLELMALVLQEAFETEARVRRVRARREQL